MSMEKSFDKRITELKPQKAVTYRFRRLSDNEFAHPSPAKLSPLEYPPVAPGQYLVFYQDAAGMELGNGALIEYVLPTGSTAEPMRSVAGQAEEAITAMDYDLEARRELDRRKSSDLFRKQLTEYVDWLDVLGVRASQEVRTKTEQADLYAQSQTRMLENNLKLLETISERISAIKTPPQPPQWDKMVAAAAPALAAMYIETVRAIRGSTSPGPSAELLLPPDEKMTKVYEVLGNVADSERLNALLQDKDKLQLWLDSVRSLVKDDPKSKPTVDAATGASEQQVTPTSQAGDPR